MRASEGPWLVSEGQGLGASDDVLTPQSLNLMARTDTPFTCVSSTAVERRKAIGVAVGFGRPPAVPGQRNVDLSALGDGDTPSARHVTK